MNSKQQPVVVDSSYWLSGCRYIALRRKTAQANSFQPFLKKCFKYLKTKKALYIAILGRYTRLFFIF